MFSLKTRGMHNFSLEIREAEQSDLDEICKIEIECFAEESFTYPQLKYYLDSPNFITLIASIKGEKAGFIVGSIEDAGGERVGHIYTIDVKLKFRRIGVGSALLKALERFFIKRGAVRSCLEVRSDNIAAKNLYLKLGYKPIGIIRDYYGLGLDAIRFEKTLRP